MCCIYLVVAEAPCDSEVFARNIGLVKLLCRKYSSLAPQDKALGEVPVELVAPAPASGGPSILVDFCHPVQIWLLYIFGHCWCLYVVYIVNIPGSVELWHKEGIAVPELGFNQRSVILFKTQGDQLVLDAVKEYCIWVVAADNKPCRRCVHIVAAECLALPVPLLKHIWCKNADLVACNTLVLEHLLCLKAGLGELVDQVLTLNHLERSGSCTTLLAHCGHSLLLFFGEVGIKDLITFFKECTHSLHGGRRLAIFYRSLLLGIHSQDSLFGELAECSTYILVLKTQGRSNLRKAHSPLILYQGQNALGRGSLCLVFSTKLC